MTVVAFQHVAGRVHLVDEVTGRTVGIGKLVVGAAQLPGDTPRDGAPVGAPLRLALIFEGTVGPFPWPDADAVPAAEPLADPPAPASPAQPDVHTPGPALGGRAPAGQPKAKRRRTPARAT